MNQAYQDILNTLPYSKPFLFVDELKSVTASGVEGTYTFKNDEYFYEGHFKDRPVTPGVILTECMAQIGVVCLGIYLSELNKESHKSASTIALSESQVDYLLPVFPGETVTVISEKEYFRFGKLKCRVKLLNGKGAIACKGVISGMVKK